MSYLNNIDIYIISWLCPFH